MSDQELEALWKQLGDVPCDDSQLTARLKAAACVSTRRSDTIGWLTISPPEPDIPEPAWYLAAILRAALRSACSSKPQARHTKRPRDRRLLRAVCPHWLHAWEVCRGSTATTVQPRASALYAIKDFSCANDHECTRRLVSVLRLTFERFRISVKFSSTSVAPGSAAATICLLRM
jgi:hypothetical protein